MPYLPTRLTRQPLFLFFEPLAFFFAHHLAFSVAIFFPPFFQTDQRAALAQAQARRRHEPVQRVPGERGHVQDRRPTRAQGRLRRLLGRKLEGRKPKDLCHAHQTFHTTLVYARTPEPKLSAL